MKRMITAVVLATALAATAISCGNDSPSSASPKSVTLVTYSGYALPEAAAKAFTKRTGIKIKLVATDDAGAALNRVLLQAGSPEGDVFFGVDNTFLGRAQKSDAFVKYSPKANDDVPREFQLDEAARFTPIDESSVCVDYDQSWFAAHQLAPPTDLQSLTDPKYKDLLVVEDAAASSPGLAFLAATHAEFKGGTDGYWRALKANGVAIAASWSDAWETRFTVSGGDRPLVVSYASSPPAEVVYATTPIDAPKSAVITSTCFRQIEFAAVLAGAPHLDAAKQLVDEMLSPEWQEGLPLSNFVFPVLPGVTLPAEFQRWAVRPPAPLEVSVKELDDHRDAWLSSWRDITE